MVYAETAAGIDHARGRFTKKWQLRCPAVVESLHEAGVELFTLARFPRSQWKAKTQASLSGQDAVLLLLFGLLRSGQVKWRALVDYQEMDAVRAA